jgi:hypothetical protein
MQTSQRPDLREPIRSLLLTLLPAAENGGAVALTALVTAVAGAKLTDDVRAQLDTRGDATFTRDGATGKTRFVNVGPETRIRLKRFDIKIPQRIAGEAIVDGSGGATLSLDRSATLSAVKLLLQVRLESLTLTERRVVVKMDSSMFDQCFDLA